MKKVLLLVILLIISLQAKERTVEEALANSKIAMQKAGAFQKDLKKQGDVLRPKIVSEKCRNVASIPFASTFTEYICYDMIKGNWNDVYCRTADSYHDELKKDIEYMKASKKEHACEMIYTDDTFDETKEKKVFSLKGFGKITIDYLDEWKVVDLEIKE